MDLPDAAKHRDRGLHEGEQSTPSVRLQMASGLCRDPITDRSSSAHSSVGSASTVAEPPARPGMSIHPQEANDRSSRLISTVTFISSIASLGTTSRSHKLLSNL